MELNLTGELESKLAHLAARQGRDPGELAREVLARYFDEEARLLEAVKRGEDAFERGDYLTHEQVGQRLGHFLRP